MPRIDKTFSSADIIRIWCDHLTKREQVEVWFVFVFVIGELLTEKLIGEFSKSMLDLFRVLKKNILTRAIIFVINETIRLFLEDKMIKVLNECFTKELRKEE